MYQRKGADVLRTVWLVAITFGTQTSTAPDHVIGATKEGRQNCRYQPRAVRTIIPICIDATAIDVFCADAMKEDMLGEFNVPSTYQATIPLVIQATSGHWSRFLELHGVQMGRRLAKM